MAYLLNGIVQTVFRCWSGLWLLNSENFNSFKNCWKKVS